MKCGAYRVAELAQVAGGRVVGDPDTIVEGVAAVGNAGPGDLVYAEKESILARALASPAACIVTAAVPPGSDRTFIEASSPRLAFARILHYLFPPRLPAPGVHETAVVSPTAALGRDVSVGPLCVVGDEAVIGDGTVLVASCFVGQGVRIGARCLIWPHAVLYPGVHLGNRVIVHAGTVVGSDGFGYAPDESGSYVKVPQLGTVVVEDDVELGANVTIDRAMLGVTVIREGTKIDNLVQIGHNVEVGPHTALSGQVGIAGSSRIGAHCVLAGQVGIGDHATIEDRVVIGAQSGVPTGKCIPKGQTVWGTPARPVEEWKRMIATLALLAKRRGRGSGVG